MHSRRHCVLQGYLAHLSKNPLTTKAVTAWFGACLGDLLAQSCAGGPFDLARNVRLGLFALCAGGPMGHYWHRFLDRWAAVMSRLCLLAPPKQIPEGLRLPPAAEAGICALRGL